MSSTESPAAPLVAVTGATGFIGRRLVPALVAGGCRVRLLLRRDPAIPEWRTSRFEVVAGDLRDPAALGHLVENADAVVHLAGLIKAARRAEFFAINHSAAAHFARITMERAPRAHFLLVSTIAAREPKLSDYAASKRAGEDAVREIAKERATVLRPTAVYGPGDRETLAFFQIARHSCVPLLGRPDARATLIHVDDLVSLIVALIGAEPTGAVVTAADARPMGYHWNEVFSAAAAAVGNRQPKFFHAPGALLRAVALCGDIGRGLGNANMLNSQKLRELRHMDWSVPEPQLARAPGWSARFELDAGFADAVAWYRAAGWLPEG
ncbi:MAG: SDR family NAD(P)-dependent oxidoreductase [Steroidobacteraceae bacterium]